MANRICKYCGSEMDLMDIEPNCETWNCMNENCNTTLTIADDFDGFERWQKEE